MIFLEEVKCFALTFCNIDFASLLGQVNSNSFWVTADTQIKQRFLYIFTSNRREPEEWDEVD